MHLLMQIALVALGSAMGGLARWGVSVGVGRWLGSGFPYGTLLINVSGSLFLGWFSTILAEKMVQSEASWIRADDLRLMLAVGFTGAYTTFSTFEYESDKMLRDGDQLAAASYIAGSVFLGLLAVRLGARLATLT